LRNRSRLIAVLISLSSVLNVVAQEPHQTGHFELSRVGLPTAIYAQASQLNGEAFAAKDEIVTPSKEIVPEAVDDIRRTSTWSIFVPDDYSPDVPYGLMVYINSTGSGKVNKQWEPILAKHRLIWVGPNKAGNETATSWRMALANEGVRQMLSRYNIDRDRIYISGRSGGGRVSSMQMLHQPDIYSGGFPIVGANPHRDLTMAKGFLPGFKFSPASFNLAKNKSRFVFLTGEKDFNREQVQGVAKQYLQDGCRFVTYLEVPGMGHDAVPVEWVEKGFIALDAPLKASAESQFENATKLLKRNKQAEAMIAYRCAAFHNSEGEFAAEAREKYTELYQQYQTELKEVETLVEAGDKRAATQAITRFKKSWKVVGEADIARLTDLLKNPPKEGEE